MTVPAVVKGWRAILLATLAGLAPAFAQPPFGVWVGVFGYGLLLYLLDKGPGERPLRAAFLRGWIAGSAYFLVCTWWVGEAFLVDVQAHGWQAPFAVVLLAGGLGLLWGGAAALYRWLAPRGVVRVLTFAAVFGLIEWLRGHILTGFPWDLPGETWRAGSAISQGAAVFGAYGMSVITLAIGAAPGVWGGADPRRSKLIVVGAAALALALLFIGGAIRLAGAAKPPSATATALRLRVVQADVEQAAKWSPEAFRDIFDTYVRLTAEAPEGRPPAVVIWPESAIPLDSGEYLAQGTWTRAALMEALKPGQILIAGAVRTEVKGGQTLYYNSVIVLRRDRDGLTNLAHYDKHHLVPFGEYMPMDALMGTIGFKALVSVGEGFTEGPAPAPIRVPGLPTFQPLICYESLFPAFVARDTPRPAFIINVSNDAWFGKTSGPWQHLNLSSYRAIEEGIPLVRATPTGVSALVDAYGRPLDQLALGQQGVIDVDLPPTAPSPPYRRLRDGLFWAMVLISLALPFVDLNGILKR